ncbi:MAG TPA: hypothetical protein VE870_10605 [Bacteroidales bacterium]|nr:hypothetical protein [Bacteroidales bacterium]
MKPFKLTLFAFASLVFLLNSCKKDEPKPDVLDYKQPAIAQRDNVIEVPQGLITLAEGGDYNAYAAMSYMELANGLSTFATDFTLPNDVQREAGDQNSAVYFWSYGGYSYWMTYKKTSEGYLWTWEWETPEIARFTYISATENPDGKSGSWSIFDPEGGGASVWTYNWSIDSDENYSATLVMNDNSTQSTFDVTDNADGSGNFVYKEDGVKTAELNWNADGSGDYWISDDNGGLSDSWPAGK